MERLIFPFHPNFLPSDYVYLLHRGEMVQANDCIQGALFVWDPATVFPPLPPFPSNENAAKGEIPDTQKKTKGTYLPNEAETFRPSAIMDFSAFGNNRQHNHPFMDRRYWTILDQPKFCITKDNENEDEVREIEKCELRKIWSILKPYSGAELVFRIPHGTSASKWKRASEIVRSIELLPICWTGSGVV